MSRPSLIRILVLKGVLALVLALILQLNLIASLLLLLLVLTIGVVAWVIIPATGNQPANNGLVSDLREVLKPQFLAGLGLLAVLNAAGWVVIWFVLDIPLILLSLGAMASYFLGVVLVLQRTGCKSGN